MLGFLCKDTSCRAHWKLSGMAHMQTPPADCAGLLILLTIIVITTNLRLIVENILKYGVLTRPQAWVLAALPRQSPLLLLSWPAMAASIVVAWAIENIGANRLRSERKVRPQHPSSRRSGYIGAVAIFQSAGWSALPVWDSRITVCLGSLHETSDDICTHTPALCLAAAE